MASSGGQMPGSDTVAGYGGCRISCMEGARKSKESTVEVAADRKLIVVAVTMATHMT